MLGKLKQTILQRTSWGKSRYLNYLYRYDFQRYLTHGGQHRNDAAVTAAKMRMLVHALEKGLSVADGSREFGREKARELKKLAEQYRTSEKKPDGQILALTDSLLAKYRQYCVEHGEDVSDPPADTVGSFPAGAVEYNAEAFPDFEKIAHARHSVRSFGIGAVQETDIVKAVALAQTAPSACNRQASRVYACKSEEKIAALKARHGGMRGFANVGAVLAVTGDLSLYLNEYERNTVFVDGGIFLMNLLYALQSVGLGACPIIWGAEPCNDSLLYQLFDIPEQEEIIALVMVGMLPADTIKIPVSHKREVDDILHILP